MAGPLRTRATEEASAARLIRPLSNCSAPPWNSRQINTLHFWPPRADVQGTPMLEMDVEDYLAPVVNGVRTTFLTARAWRGPRRSSSCT